MSSEFKCYRVELPIPDNREMAARETGGDDDSGRAGNTTVLYIILVPTPKSAAQSRSIRPHISPQLDADSLQGQFEERVQFISGQTRIRTSLAYG